MLTFCFNCCVLTMADVGCVSVTVGRSVAWQLYQALKLGLAARAQQQTLDGRSITQHASSLFHLLVYH